MTRCYFCGESTEGLPHKCKYCGKIHCSDHLLPENHDCKRLGQSKRSFYFKPKRAHHFRRHNIYSDYVEMYHPSQSKFKFRNPFKELFSFRLSHKIRDALTQFIVILFIGLTLDYVYYQNFSLHYLFVGGVNEWFSVLIAFLNYGLGRGYDVLYLIINGLFYFYLFSISVRLAHAVLTNLNKKGTWVFLVSITVLIFAIFKYFPNLIY